METLGIPWVILYWICLVRPSNLWYAGEASVDVAPENPRKPGRSSAIHLAYGLKVHNFLPQVCFLHLQTLKG